MKNILTAAALGAMGGHLVAPDDNKFSGALQGALWGGLAGGGTAGLIAKLRKKPVLQAIKKVSMGEAVRDSVMVTGLTAALNKVTGAYDKNKKPNKIVTTFGPAVDDVAMIGIALAKGIR